MGRAPVTYEESLRILIWDKAGLALIGLTLGILLTHYLARRAKAEDHAALAVEELARRKRETAIRIIDNDIALLERRINEFLWPLSLFLRIDDAVWVKIPGLHTGAQNMPTKAGAHVESQCLLPNHYRAVELIERHFNLVAQEEELTSLMIDYVCHVAVFKALREANIKLNPIDVDSEFPSGLPAALQSVLTRSLDELSELKVRRSDQAAALTGPLHETEK